MVKIILDIKQNIEKNAEKYFEKAKKARHKIDGTKEILEKTKKQIKDLKEKKQIKEIKEKKINKTIDKKWFHKFRWFVSSSGFLVIGGRGATTNEILIKKHTEQGDLVFHTDAAGSPFFVIKSEKKKIDEATIQETADATVSFSRAWKNGILTEKVFHVQPDQVSKKANTGEYLTKGAFMIRGRTKYVDNKVNLAVGVYGDSLMCGPVKAIENNCDEYFIVEQGSQKVSKVAKKIQRHFLFKIDDIIRVLPSGGIKLKEKVVKK